MNGCKQVEQWVTVVGLQLFKPFEIGQDVLLQGRIALRPGFGCHEVVRQLAVAEVVGDILSREADGLYPVKLHSNYTLYSR